MSIEIENSQEARRSPADARHAAILEVATKVFAEKGFRRTDVQEIADKVGVGKGTVYRHFGTKQNLFLAAVDKGVADLVQVVLTAIAPHDDPIEKIFAGVEEYFRFFDQHRDLTEIFIQERSEFRGRSKATYFTYRDNNISLVEDTLQKGVTRGVFRPMNVKQCAEILADMAFGIVIAHLMKGEQTPLVSRTRDVLDVYFNGIRRVPAGRTSA